MLFLLLGYIPPYLTDLCHNLSIGHLCVLFSQELLLINDKDHVGGQVTFWWYAHADGPLRLLLVSFVFNPSLEDRCRLLDMMFDGLHGFPLFS